MDASQLTKRVRELARLGNLQALIVRAATSKRLTGRDIWDLLELPCVLKGQLKRLDVVVRKLPDLPLNSFNRSKKLSQ